MTMTNKTISELEGIAEMLREQQESIAVTESVTVGLLQYALSSAEHASQFFQGGLTAFNLGQKTKHLDVEPIQVSMCNCVSGAVAKQMAIGAAKLFKSIWGIGITGYATPVPESGGQVYCYYALSNRERVVQLKKIDGSDHQGEQAQNHFVNVILEEWHALLKHNHAMSG